ncbi:MAG: hypothetical protein IKX96_03955 [Firmicutes bacterium]|nr:hypothetical protein [Bacillota bacterium]
MENNNRSHRPFHIILAAVLALAMTFAVFGCDRRNGHSENGSSGAETEA